MEKELLKLKELGVQKDIVKNLQTVFKDKETISEEDILEKIDYLSTTTLVELITKVPDYCTGKIIDEFMKKDPAPFDIVTVARHLDTIGTDHRFNFLIRGIKSTGAFTQVLRLGGFFIDDWVLKHYLWRQPTMDELASLIQSSEECDKDFMREAVKNRATSRQMARIIRKYKKFRTEDMIKAFKKLEPSLDDIIYVLPAVKGKEYQELLNYFFMFNPSATVIRKAMQEVKKLQRPEMLALFKALRPDPEEVAELIITVKKFRSWDMIVYFKNLNPTTDLVVRVMIEVPIARENLLIEYLRSKNPTYTEIGDLIANIKKYQTKQMIDWFMSMKPNPNYAGEVAKNIKNDTLQEYVYQLMKENYSKRYV